MINRFFRLSENSTTLRREVVGGAATFFAMAYIIFVQPAVLSGRMFGIETGLDFGAVMTATCISAALATSIMALYARYPIAQAPGMGMNFFFVLTVLPAITAAGFANAWQVALGVVFIAGLLFLLISMSGIRELIMDAISPSMKAAIAAGIGLFIALIGLQNASLVVVNHTLSINPHFASPDLIVFFFGLFVTGALYARGMIGSILWGILATTTLAIVLKIFLPHLGGSELVTSSMLNTRFELANGIVSTPPSLAPTFFKMDLMSALSVSMLPFILIFLIMDLFDTVGTLIGVGTQAGLLQNGRLPRARQAMISDAIGTSAGACLGTSTVTSFIESAAGVAQGARTGLAGLVTASLFLVALFVSPLVAMVGSYPPITAPVLVIVGALMARNIVEIDWSDFGEVLPAFLTVVGIPATFSIADGIALGLISYPVFKIASGRGRQVHWLMYLMAGFFVLYYLFIRS